MPPEYCPAVRPAASVSPNCSSSSSARRAAALAPSLASRPNSTRFCRPLSCSSTAAYWPVSPMRART